MAAAAAAAGRMYIHVLTSRCDHESLSTKCVIITSDDVQEAIRTLLHERKQDTRWGRFVSCLKLCSVVVYVFACPPCPPCIIKKVAFRPFEPPTYKFVPFGPPSNGEYRMRLSKTLEFMNAAVLPNRQIHSLFRCFYVPQLDTKKRIACVYCPQETFGLLPNGDKKVVIFSHTNGGDLGLLAMELAWFSRMVRVDVVAYDYSGYGRSDGKCSEQSLYENVECVYDYLVGTMLVPADRIVAVGISLGTCATIHLAVNREISGAILGGSFSSAMRTLCPKRIRGICCDQLVNINKIGQVVCPTLFVHGEEDKLFKLDHMELLRENCPGAASIEPLVLQKCGHLGFEQRTEYWSRLNKFVHEELQQQ